MASFKQCDINKVISENESAEEIISRLIDAVSIAHNSGKSEVKREIIDVTKKFCHEQLDNASPDNAQVRAICSFVLKVLESDEETVCEFLEHV